MKKLLLMILCAFTFISAQEKVRIMHYNLLHYPDYSDTRNQYYKKIIDEIKPDIIEVNEIKYQSSVDEFVSKVLGDKYKAGTFIRNRYDNTNNSALFYRDSLIEFLSNNVIYVNDAPRDIFKFTVVHKFTKDTLYIFSSHFKASSGSSNEVKRDASAKVLRNYTDKMPSNTNYILCGDLNLYGASEPAYQTLLNTTTQGYFIDPIDKPGEWHNNSAFAKYHTQCPRLNQFQGGSSGGMDDRFDFILISPEIHKSGGIDYVEGSYEAFGNDGYHYNKSINDGKNYAVSQDIADALYYASDHLPVIADFTFDGTTSVSDNSLLSPNNYILEQNYPNPFNPTTTIKYSIPEKENIRLDVVNTLGQVVKTLVNDKVSSGNYEISVDMGNLSSGIYFYRLITKNSILVKKMVLMK